MASSLSGCGTHSSTAWVPPTLRWIGSAKHAAPTPRRWLWIKRCGTYSSLSISRDHDQTDTYSSITTTRRKHNGHLGTFNHSSTTWQCKPSRRRRMPWDVVLGIEMNQRYLLFDDGSAVQTIPIMGVRRHDGTHSSMSGFTKVGAICYFRY